MILVTFAGLRDPVAEDTTKEGSIVTLCKRRKEEGNPVDHLWLLSMDEKGQQCTQETENWLTTEGLLAPEQIHRKHQAGNPADYVAATQFAFAFMQSEEFRGHLASHPHPVAFNASSGTPAMKMTGFLLAAANLLPNGEVWTVSNPRFAKEEDRVTSADMNLVREHILRDQIRTAVQGSQFTTALKITREWSRITVHEANRQAVPTLERLLKAYQAQDQANYADAKKHMTAITGTDLFSDPEVATVFRAQRTWLTNDDLSHATENVYNLVEILFSVARYNSQERYTDALARGRRLFEGIVYWYYQTHYGIDVGSSPAQWETALGTQLAKQTLTLHGTRLSDLAQGMFDATIPSSSTANWSKAQSELKDMMTTRNKSLAAHGMKPVSAPHVETVYPILKDVLRAVIPETARHIEHYPLTEAKRQRVLQALGV